MGNDVAFKNYPVSWSLITLGELLDKDGGSVQTGPFGSQLHAADYVDVGIPSVMPKNISIEGINQSDIARITEGDAQRLSKYLLAANDIVYSRRGDVEKCALVKEHESGWLCGTGCLRIRLDKSSRVTPNYLHAYLSSPVIREWISRNAIGATMPNLNTSILRGVPVLVPEQKDIIFTSQIWNELNLKIQLNRQTNQTLEQMAQALFKSWFVDFDPVIDNAIAAGNPIPDEMQGRAQRRQQQLAKSDHTPLPDDILRLFPSEFELTEELGWVPLGWKVNVVENILIRLKAGKRYSKKEVSSFGQVPVYEQGQDILLGYHNDEADFRASMEEPMFIFGDHTCVTKLGVEPFSISANVIPLKGKVRNTYWTYFAVKDLQRFEEYRRHWMEFAIKSVIVPSVEVADLFSHSIGTNTQKSKELVKSSNTLTRLRDTLLPKLISGELRLQPEAVCGEDTKLS
jgi:type I restriction enzyme S subunit